MTDRRQERRQGPRVALSSRAQVRSSRGEVLCWVADLSESGILLRPQRASCLPSEPLVIRFALRPEETCLRLEGRIARYELTGQGPLWGVEFTGLPPELAKKISAFISGELRAVRDLPPLPVQAQLAPSSTPHAGPGSMAPVSDETLLSGSPTDAADPNGPLSGAHRPIGFQQVFFDEATRMVEAQQISPLVDATRPSGEEVPEDDETTMRFVPHLADTWKERPAR